MSAILAPSSVLPPLRSSQKAADINDFFDLVGQALAGYMKTEGVPKGTAPVYVESFPKERLSQEDTPFDVITYHVAEGGMAPVLNDGTIPRVPQLRYNRTMKEQFGYNEVTYGWWETNTVIFEIWSKTNPNANDMALWFHRFLIRYAAYYKFFEAYGIKQFQYVKRLEDSTELKENQELQKRQLAYSFRLEYLDFFVERQLTDLSLNVSIGQEVCSIDYPAE